MKGWGSSSGRAPSRSAPPRRRLRPPLDWPGLRSNSRRRRKTATSRRFTKLRTPSRAPRRLRGRKPVCPARLAVHGRAGGGISGRSYERELLAAGNERGLKISRQDDRLVIYPSILRLLPEARAVQVDRTRVTGLRPSRLVAHLQANQSKKPRFKPERFLESLYKAYKLVVGAKGVQGTTLVAVYQALTLLPGADREYDKADFARDLYFLQSSGTTSTRTGARVSFPASTGTKGGSQLFTFVGPDGRPAVFYGITFTESRT